LGGDQGKESVRRMGPVSFFQKHKRNQEGSGSDEKKRSTGWSLGGLTWSKATVQKKEPKVTGCKGRESVRKRRGKGALRRGDPMTFGKKKKGGLKRTSEGDREPLGGPESVPGAFSRGNRNTQKGECFQDGLGGLRNDYGRRVQKRLFKTKSPFLYKEGKKKGFRGRPCELGAEKMSREKLLYQGNQTKVVPERKALLVRGPRLLGEGDPEGKGVPNSKSKKKGEKNDAELPNRKGGERGVNKNRGSQKKRFAEEGYLNLTTKGVGCP